MQCENKLMICINFFSHNYKILLLYVNIFHLFVYFKGIADRTSLKIYEDIQSDLFCFRRLNATHQIGCACKLFKLDGFMFHFV